MPSRTRPFRSAHLLALLGVMLVLGTTTSSLARSRDDVFFQIRQEFFGTSIDDLLVEERLLELKRQWDVKESPLGLFWHGKVYFLLGEIAELRGDRDRAFHRFSQSHESALQYAAAESTSKGQLLLANTYLRLMPYRGTLYSMRHTRTALRLLDEVTHMDPLQYQVYISLAIFHLHAPRIAGGSATRAVEYAAKALESPHKIDRFAGYHWMGYAYLASEDKAQAELCFQHAVRLFPETRFAVEYPIE